MFESCATSEKDLISIKEISFLLASVTVSCMKLPMWSERLLLKDDVLPVAAEMGDVLIVKTRVQVYGIKLPPANSCPHFKNLL